MPIDLQDLSQRLFATAEQLWTNTALRPDQYGQPVLALIALRQMKTRFSDTKRHPERDNAELSRQD